MNSTSLSGRQNALITGLPRSGTTLICHLLNKIPDCVALHEPMQPTAMRGMSPGQVTGEICDFFDAQRHMILEQGIATSKAWGGAVPSNPLSDEQVGRARKWQIDGREIRVSKVFGRDFALFIKHPSMFTACLPFLSTEFSCYASVRNPLSVLLSWRNAGMPMTQGRVPAAELFDPKMAKRLDTASGIIDRQLILLDYFFGRFRDYLPGRVVRYEEVVASQGRALALLHPGARNLAEELSLRNDRALGSDPDAARVAERLLAHDNACWDFYSRQDVQRLLP